jgi:hypothetical protein
MATRKLTNWSKVTAGDIISFRYPSKGSTKLHSILVLGKNIPYKKNDGSKTLHLAGMKVEMSNSPLVSPQALLQNLQNAGNIILVEKVTPIEAIIKIDVGGKPNEKRVDADFKKIEPFMKRNNLYRTYDYAIAKKYTVYYEPIKLNAQIIKNLEAGK